MSRYNIVTYVARRFNLLLSTDERRVQMRKDVRRQAFIRHQWSKHHHPRMLTRKENNRKSRAHKTKRSKTVEHLPSKSELSLSRIVAAVPHRFETDMTRSRQHNKSSRPVEPRSDSSTPLHSKLDSTRKNTTKTTIKNDDNILGFPVPTRLGPQIEKVETTNTQQQYLALKVTKRTKIVEDHPSRLNPMILKIGGILKVVP